MPNRRQIAKRRREERRKPVKIDHVMMSHETLLGDLTESERHAFAVHMQAAQSEARSAGAASPAMLCELIGLAHSAEQAATRKVSKSGLVLIT